MPAYLVQRFASIVGRDIEFVLTGKSKNRRKRGHQEQPQGNRSEISQRQHHLP